MMDFSNKGPIKVSLQKTYQHDGDYERCAYGRRKLRSDRLYISCHDGML